MRLRWMRWVVALCLLVVWAGCGESSAAAGRSRSGGAAGMGGAAGIGGEAGMGGAAGVGGAAGAGGAGGAGGEGENKHCYDDPRGEQVICDKFRRYTGETAGVVTHFFRQQWVDIHLEPGEVVTLTRCGFYVLTDFEPRHHPEEPCIYSDLTFEEHGPVHETLCNEVIVTACELCTDTVTELGFEEIWVRRH